MLQRIALLALAAPRRILVVAALVVIGAAVFGIPVATSLSAGGFQDPASPSAHASQLLLEQFGRSDMQLVVLISDPAGVDSTAARALAAEVAEHLQRSPHVLGVTSAWAPGPEAAQLTSRDGTSGMVVAGLVGGEDDAQHHAADLAQTLPQGGDGVDVRAGGSAMVFAQVNHQTQWDVLVMELIAIPLSFVVLVWVFGGLLCAMLPLAVGGIAIVGGMSVLRLITYTTDVSIFALNLTTAIGLALAIDYTLLIVSRYREELAEGADPRTALVHTMTAAGRTVLFSAVTVALSLSAMILFPMYFLKSFAYAGIATVAVVAVAAIAVTPAAIVVLGPRLDALDVRRLGRRLLRRAEPAPKPVEQLFWYRAATFVMRRALPIGLAVVALLLALGAPFLGVSWGYPDDRVLPTSASSRQVGDALREEFAVDSAAAVTVVVPDVTGVAPGELDRYAAELSRVADVSAVSPPAVADGSAFLTVGSTAPLFSESSARQLDALEAVPGPGGRTVALTGSAAANRDSVAAILARLPLVLGLIATVTLVLLFLLTGSVALPLKALLLNALSLTATFGALVWIFQDGHLGALGTTSTGTLVANVPVLLFCIAFGLSMDYEVFLVSRIREFWCGSAQGDTDNDRSVALGLARTGRVVTAAALVMSISFAALIAAQVSFMRMFGLGLTLAVLVDATLVRMVLLPAFMHVLGRWNWWAPRPLTRLHARFGISERPTPLPGSAS
ncbi:MMPL family transporter [Mycolicibacterium sp.]|uniref:MMPL family transporter n=1 Tax=Mycolicibacterium sp. TaxID=2320850 RepID=UPI003D110F27